MMDAIQTSLPSADVGLVTDAELDAVNGGFLFVLVGAAAFSTGFFAGYGAVRFAQDMAD